MAGMLLMKIISTPSCFNFISLADLCSLGLEEICLTTTISTRSQTELDSFTISVVCLLRSAGITAMPPPEAWRESSRKGRGSAWDKLHYVSGSGFAHSQLNYKLSSSQITGGYTESLCQLLQTTQQSASQAKSTAKAQQWLVSEQAGVAFLASLSGSLQYNRTFLTDYIKISWPFHCFPNRFKLLSACRMSHKALIRTDKCLLGKSAFVSFCCPSKSPPMSKPNTCFAFFLSHTSGGSKSKIGLMC